MTAAALAAGTIVACGQLKKGDEGVDATQLQLRMDIVGGTDVAAMQFDLQAVDCNDGAALPKPPLVIRRDLEDLLIPSDVPQFAGKPLDGASAHVFGDAFVTLAPGCYSVKTTPLDSTGRESKDCAMAALANVKVLPAKTTEVFLVNQCRGVKAGAIDVASALNHPPELVSVVFEKSKFIPRCDVQGICATVKDPDGDPIDWSWSVTGADHAGPRVTSTKTNDDGTVTQCVQIIPQCEGKLDVTVTAYDVLQGASGPEHIEQWLTEQGYPGESHVTLTFPVYSSPTGRKPSPEICDGIDNDCDFDVDEGLTTDADRDGYTSADSCLGSKDDCNDGDPAINPGAPEICDKVDNNCTGGVDEGGVCPVEEAPECAGQTCETFTACNAGGSCSDTGVCGSTPGGRGLCVNGATQCEGLADCSSGDCAGGAICIVNSCCGRPVCVPQDRFCSKGAARAAARAVEALTPAEPMTPVDGPTLGKQ